MMAEPMKLAVVRTKMLGAPQAAGVTQPGAVSALPACAH